MDRRLSHNNTLSCSMCHVPEQGFTSNELRTAVGIEGRSMNRNSPTLLNVSFSKFLFHDGRETSLENQVWGPFLTHNEMANPSIGHVIDTIYSLPDYDGVFENAFNGNKADIKNIGVAIAAYERTLIAGNSKFDQWYYGGDTMALSRHEIKGFELFTGKAKCSTCHTINSDYALFTDNLFHNTGIGWEASMGKKQATQKVQLAPGVFVDVKQSIITSFSAKMSTDVGRYAVTRDPDDRWKYKTPTLRNIELTAPYMHDGSLATLDDVIDFYSMGGIQNPLLDPLIAPLKLSSEEKNNLLSFLQSLTSDNMNRLINDARPNEIYDQSTHSNVY